MGREGAERGEGGGGEAKYKLMHAVIVHHAQTMTPTGERGRGRGERRR